MKENHVQILEKLFNDVLHAPDLKKEILDYIQPDVLKAHQLIHNNHNENHAHGMTQTFEEKRQLENLLYRDLPNLVSDYVSLDLTYRNEKKLKNQQTHRQSLIENLQFIVAKLTDLQDSMFAGHDTKANSANQILEAKYGQPQTQVQPLKSHYDWDTLKKSLLSKNVEKAYSHYSFLNKGIKDDNFHSQQKIALINDQVQYRAKNRLIALALKYHTIKDCMKNKTGLKTDKDWQLFRQQIKKKLFFPGIPVAMVTLSLLSIIWISNQAAQTVNTKTTLSDVISSMNTTTTVNARDEAMNILHKMTNPDSLYYHKNLTVAFEGKKVTATLGKMGKSVCEDMHTYLDTGAIMTDGYVLNGVHVNSLVNDKDQYAHDAALCHTGNNTIVLSEDMTTTGERIAQIQMQIYTKNINTSEQAKGYAKAVNDNLEIQEKIIDGMMQGLQQNVRK